MKKLTKEEHREKFCETCPTFSENDSIYCYIYSNLLLKNEKNEICPCGNCIVKPICENECEKLSMYISFLRRRKIDAL